MSVVFRGYLAENLRFGHILEICGKAKRKEAKSFNIFLATGDPTTDLNTNIGLYMHVNFENDKVILKKLINNQWSEEEGIDYETQNLLEIFSIYIVMADDKFHIGLIGKPLLTYKYGGLSLKSLKFMEIDGDLEYIRQVDHRKYFPYTWPPIQVVEQRIQFSNDVPMPFKVGHVIVISAQLLGNDKGRFLIQLRNIWDSERQELHLSIRFDTRIIARNSKTKQDGEHFEFDDEQRDDNFPFKDFYRPFKVAMAFTKDSILLAKDGLSLFDFAYRTSNVLPFIGGLKMFGIDGTEIRVSGIDHIQMEDSLCTGFEEYSNLNE